MDPEDGFKPQSEDIPPSESSSLPSMQQSATNISETSALPKLPSGISITPATLESKPTFAHPSVKPLDSGSQMPPPSSIGGQIRPQSQQNLGDPDDQEDDDDESEEDSDSDEDDDGVEEVGIDDSDDEEGEDGAEVSADDSDEDDDDEDKDDDDKDDDDKDDDDADESEDEDEEGDESDDEDDDEEEEDDPINMSSSMLGGDSEMSAMSEDVSLASSISGTPAKKASSQHKQDSNQTSKAISGDSILSESPSVSGTSTPKGSIAETPVGTGKKRGRPSKAVMKEREEAKRARGELPDPKPEKKDKEKKKRGRKPKVDWSNMSEEQREILKQEKRSELREKRAQKMRELRQQKKDNRASAKIAILKEKADRKAARKAASEAKKTKKKEPKKKGPAKKILTEAEREAREALRKAKYEEFKAKKADEKEKRRIRNEELRQKRKDKKEEERRQREAYDKRMQELKASFLDETSQMSGDQKLDINDETSQSSMSNSMKPGLPGPPPTGRVYGMMGAQEMSALGALHKFVTAQTLLEYRWPLEGRDSEHYFLQEQVSEYLGVKSFKRRYPDVQRRQVDHEERDFLVEMKVVNVTQADLGLTAIPSIHVLDIMCNDFYDKYDEYMNVVAERKDRTMRQTNYQLANVEAGHMADFVEKAVRDTAAWNKHMNAERREKRTACFDMQTFNIHYPMNGRGKMKVLPKRKLGHYPIALIPGQFVDYHEKFTASQLKYLPLNTAIKTAPPNKRLRDLASDGSASNYDSDIDSDSSTSSSGSNTTSSSSSSESDSEEEESSKVTYKREIPQGKSIKVGAATDEGKTQTEHSHESNLSVVENKPTDTKPIKPVDQYIPGATCSRCQGDYKRNKIGLPEKMLNCTKCNSCCHPTCISLCLELLQYVTKYNWECSECKGCSKCNDHSDEDKMLFCDLCDRGYHIYCVGLDDIPSGRWHCVECAICSSCGAKDVSGEDFRSPGKTIDTPSFGVGKWAFEYKNNAQGTKIFSQQFCIPCHKLWRRAQFCPECNRGFGREVKESSKTYWACWVCSRQHHSSCVGQERFICAACQKRTLDKSIGAVQRFSQQLNSSSNVGFASDTRTREMSRRIVEMSSSDTSFSGMSGGTMLAQSHSSPQFGSPMGSQVAAYATSPSKTYSRPIQGIRTSTIVSITPGGEITPIGTVTATPRTTKPYPYPRSNAAAATIVGGTSNTGQQIASPLGVIPPEQLLENQCDLCAKVYKNRSTLYSHKNRDHGIRGGAAMNNPKS